VHVPGGGCSQVSREGVVWIHGAMIMQLLWVSGQRQSSWLFNSAQSSTLLCTLLCTLATIAAFSCQPTLGG
jgi:hypothetical protein